MSNNAKRHVGLLSKMVGRVPLNDHELAVWHQGYSTSGASEDELEFFTTLHSIQAGSVILLPTLAYESVWTIEDEFTFAVISIQKVEEVEDGSSRVTFKVIGHLDDKVTNHEAFATVGATYRVTGEVPSSFLSITSESVDAVLAQFAPPPAEVRSDGRLVTGSSGGSGARKLVVGGNSGSSRSGKLSAASSIFFDDEDNPENASSVEQKVIVDTDGRQHIFSSKFAMQIMQERQVFMRVMHSSRTELLLRNHVGYMRDVWDAALSPYSVGGAAVDMDEESVSLSLYHRLERMPMTPEQLDAARQCKWVINNWAHLSIINFHENPFGGESMYQGADQQSRAYLRDCVLGYQMFLTVYFTNKASSSFLKLVQWLSDVKIHRDRRFDAEFIRARIDRMLVDFWSEVRFAGSQSPRFRHLSFAKEGEIWLILEAYETELLERLERPLPSSGFLPHRGRRVLEDFGPEL